MKANRLYTGMMALTLSFAGAAFLTSCSSDEIVDQQGGDGQTLTISVSPSSTVRTRAAAFDVSEDNENTVNHFIVGIFNADGKKLGIEKQTTKDNNKLTVGAPDYKIGNTVLVAVNTPENLFDNVETAEEFKAKTMTIGEALYGNPDHVASNNLADNNYIPMYGEGTLVSAGKSKQYKADVNVYHLVSKISLTSLDVNFTGTYAGATFKPTEIFVSNVPTKVGLGMADQVANYTYTTNDTYVTGEQTTDSPDASSTVTPSDYPYLSTGELKTWAANEANKEATYNTNMPVLYTLPNDQTAEGLNKATFLVIKGKFNYNGKEETCYYPFYMNYNTADGSAADDGEAKKLHPNINYQVSVKITGKGTDSPVKPVNRTSASINVTVHDFTDVEQEYHDVANDHNIYNVSATDVGKVISSTGNIYDNVSDAIAAGETAIAMIAYVGSNTGNSTYNHGLAIALKDAGTNNWNSAGSTATSYNVAVPSTGTSGWFHGSKDQWTTIMGGTSGYGGTLNTEMTACGGTALSGHYWSATETSTDYAWHFDSIGWNDDNSYYSKSVSNHVRSCLAF